MGTRPGMRVYHWAWCLGGFLIPAAIWVIGQTYFRAYPPTDAELAAAAIQPDVLSRWIRGLALTHVVAGTLAVTYWHTRWPVWVATVAQVACTLYAWFLSVMAVQGLWMSALKGPAFFWFGPCR